jgi:adenine-specific DNA-methyltransferase
MAKKQSLPLDVDIFRHDEATRKNIPTAEHQSVMEKDAESPVRVAYERRNRDLDPQLVWRGKDEQDWSELVVPAPPLYIQEKVHPKVLIDDLMRRSRADAKAADTQFDLFADFNGLPDEDAKTEFYRHDAHWANRMILGDSLQVMASLAEREGLRGKVQCFYFDPPYGIRFNSNFQWSTTSRDVKDGNTDHITREPEQVKAFRDTWRDGIHSYLTYLRDRLTVARDLLTESGSIFVQIGDENVHRVRAVMDEVFGDQNYVSQIAYSTTTGRADQKVSVENDFILFYAKNIDCQKFRPQLVEKNPNEIKSYKYAVDSTRSYARTLGADNKDDIIDSDREELAQLSFAVSQDPGKPEERFFKYQGQDFDCGKSRHWKTRNPEGLKRLGFASRLFPLATQLNYVRLFSDNKFKTLNNTWLDTGSAGYSSADPKRYVVQTDSFVIQRCILMTTDPGDLVLDPTCGSGTTAFVAEQWGRRWITIDTSRVALALARARIMGARYSYYLLADSRDGQLKEAEITGSAPSSQPARGDIRHGFVYERVPHITLKSIANNSEIDVIWERHQQRLEPLRQQLNNALGKQWQEWEIPREALKNWPEEARSLHVAWWEERIARQQEIDASIAAKAEFEYLYDKPYIDRKRVRVAGPFTVESLSPHRVLGVDENDGLIDSLVETGSGYDDQQSFVSMILENLRTSGVQQANKSDKIDFISLTPWPGELVCAEGRYLDADGATERRAAIFIGPEFGTVSRSDLVGAAREAGDAGFDVLVACAFNYDAHSSEFNKLGRIPVLKARMNADLHMSGDLKNTGKGNLFVIFGEPDIDILDAPNGQIQVRVNGVDVFHPNTGEVRSDGAEGIACWFIDTDYNMESFFVRQAYFLGANDPYKALKTTLKSEINEQAWATLNSNISRPFNKPDTGRIAVKVINHLGDEVMKVYRV